MIEIPDNIDNLLILARDIYADYVYESLTLEDKEIINNIAEPLFGITLKMKRDKALHKAINSKYPEVSEIVSTISSLYDPGYDYN